MVLRNEHVCSLEERMYHYLQKRAANQTTECSYQNNSLIHIIKQSVGLLCDGDNCLEGNTIVSE